LIDTFVILLLTQTKCRIRQNTARSTFDHKKLHKTEQQRI